MPLRFVACLVCILVAAVGIYASGCVSTTLNDRSYRGHMRAVEV